VNKRTTLKLLAFIVGLYFFLDYILPEKVGGDFDCYEVTSAAPIETSDGLTVFYNGQYSKVKGAVGRLVKTKEGWIRSLDTLKIPSHLSKKASPYLIA